MIKKLWIVTAFLFLAACGGGGGGGGGNSTGGGGGSPSGGGGSPPGTLSNFATLTVDAGPASLGASPAANVAYVSVTICAPGSTTNCQTIDHVLVDTASVGLRIFQSVINSSLLSALPHQTDASANPVGECYAFVDGFVFGSVRSADFQIGGESVASMPLQVIADGGAFTNVPASCSNGGGTNLNTVQEFEANGIIGIGVTTTDCGANCASGLTSAATYYDCPNTGCSTIISRTASPSAPFQQLPNPVAAFSVDNNGTMISLPTVPSGGSATLTGTIYFGIGTQTNNGLGSAKVYTTTNSQSSNGPGLFTALYKTQTLNQSFIDSGSSLYFFVDNAITACSTTDDGGAFTGLYCPTPSTTVSPTIEGQNGASTLASFTLNNAETLFLTNNAALPGVGGNPNTIGGLTAFPRSFDFGLPFFYGRNIYTAIEGRAAGSATGPYFAF